MRLAAIAVLCLFVLTGQTMAGQAPRAVPGTMVSLVPLDNYTPTDRFSGFIDRETGGSIVVTQMAKAAFDAYDTDDLARLRPHFAPVGIAIDAAERTTIDGHRAVLLHGHKGKSRIRSLRIWVALIQADQTILLTRAGPGRRRAAMSSTSGRCLPRRRSAHCRRSTSRSRCCPTGLG